jgi:hypothetical protein
MRESRLYGSVRGAVRNDRPYRDLMQCRRPSVDPLVGADQQRSRHGQTQHRSSRLSTSLPRLRRCLARLTSHARIRAGLLMPARPGASWGKRARRLAWRWAYASSRGYRRVLASGRSLLVRFFLERSRDNQADCRDDCEQRYASRCRKTSGPDHKQEARVANFRLVQERIAFNDHEYGNRRPEAEANEPAAHATR